MKKSGSKTQLTRCNSKWACNPKKPSIKNTLPPNYRYKKCPACLQVQRTKDNELYARKKKQALQIMKKDPNKRICTACGVGKTYNLADMGVRKDGSVSNLCKLHLEKQRITESKRDKEAKKEKDRKRSKEYEKRPERKALKKKWNEENKTKVYTYSILHRKKKRLENEKAFLKKNADTARKRRMNHPEDMKKLRIKRRTIPEYAYAQYVIRSNNTGYELKISQVEFTNLVTSKCYYCSKEYQDVLLSLDRLDNTKCYELSNIVPACNICNMMKNTLNESTFILMCAHIAHFTSTGKPGPFAHVFNNYCSADFEDYKRRAEQKNLVFEITDELFNATRCNYPCYICGRISNSNHINGIDRVNNEKGYTYDNILSCCGDCNFMKKDMSWDFFVVKCARISRTHESRLKHLKNIWTPSSFIAKNKLKPSKEELKIAREKRNNERKKARELRNTPESIAKRIIELGHNKEGETEQDIINELLPRYSKISKKNPIDEGDDQDEDENKSVDDIPVYYSNKKEKKKEKEIPIDKIDDSDPLRTYTCTRCSKNKKYTRDEMGIRKNGLVSVFCKKHLDEKRQADYRRDRREEFVERNKCPERKAAKKLWNDNNKEWMRNYMREYRARKRLEKQGKK